MDATKHNYVTVFAGKRDGYHGALALHETGNLTSLVTDFYCPDALDPILARVPAQWAAKVAGRRNPELPSHVVDVRLGRVVRAVRDRILHLPAVSNDWVLGRHAALLSAHRNAGSIVYHPYWNGFLSATIEEQKRSAPRILFQYHPVAHQVRDLLGAARQRGPHDYAMESEELLSVDQVERVEADIMEADGIIVASTFVRQGLVEIGYPPDKIFVVPYGVQGQAPTSARRQRDSKRDLPVLRVLFVGQVTYRKGLHYLLDAISLVSPNTVELTIVGRTVNDSSLLERKLDNVRVLTEISPAELKDLYLTHDIFAMPSILEGFGLVYLEAMASGMPIIGTPYTGAPDIVDHGVNGFIVEPHDVEAIAEILRKLQSNPQMVSEMSARASSSVSVRSWVKYRRDFREAVREIERAWDGD